MIKPVPFANALAIVAAVCYALGMLLALIAPGVYLALLQTWVFLDLARIAPVSMTVTGFIVGLVTGAVGFWIIGWAIAALYNMLSEAREVSI